MTVVVLAGGTGGAKLARGMADVIDDLVVIANTADDIEIHGAHVSPDPDLVAFWLADRIDARGWGLEGDTFHAMERLGNPWFALGDEDLEIGRDRLRRLRGGERLTETLAALTETLGVRARVLPMCDEPVRTFIDGTPFQEWMIRAGGKAGELRPNRIEIRGEGTLTPEVAEALAAAHAVVIGPSNPIVSIGPILAVEGMREALKSVPVVAVSPFVGGRILKGPTVPCLLAAGVDATLDGVVGFYGDLLDGIVADERASDVPTLETDVLMGGAEGRERLARESLTFAIGFAP